MYITITILTIFLFSCAGEASYGDDLSSNIAADVKTEAYEEATEGVVEEDMESSKELEIPTSPGKCIHRKLIKEGTITFETDNSSETKKLIHGVANNLNGYLAKDNEYAYSHRIQHDITIRVPTDKFDQLLIDISKSINEIDDKNISVRDVTEEYVDVEARLNAKKIVEIRYLELLKKAHSVGDVLVVEHELARIREDIERAEGRLRYLKDQVSLSTLHITFYETIEVEEDGFEFFEKAGKGFQNGYNGLLWVFIGIINVWPFMFFLGGIAWLIVRLIKKSLKKNK